MKPISIFVCLVLAMATGQAQAQFVVKRVKCADAVRVTNSSLPKTPFHFNSTPGTKDLSVQITRDGCRPRLLLGQFQLRVKAVGGGEITFSQMIRDTRVPSSTTEPIGARQLGYVTFTNPGGGKILGTFDYSYTLE